jgi:hypothetical protein
MSIQKTAIGLQEFKEFYYQMLLLHSTGLKVQRCTFNAILAEE